MPTHGTLQALLITGTVGAGKTTIANAVGGLLTDAEIPNAIIDLDGLRRSWPTPPGDSFNFAMALRNLHSVARNYLQAGVIRLVLAGVAESRDDRQRYQDAIGVDLAVCRLRVDLPVIHQRLARRHEGEQEALRWHLDRSGQLDNILQSAKVEDVVVDVTNYSVTGAATSVMKSVGWH